jgi:hypothetical protein
LAGFDHGIGSIFPLSGWCLITAYHYHHRALLVEMPLSVLLMAFPVLMLLLKPVLGYE